MHHKSSPAPRVRALPETVGLKPDGLDRINTGNHPLMPAVAIVPISGDQALQAHLGGDLRLGNLQIVTMVAIIPCTSVLDAIRSSFAERLTREKT